jgi:hypothetical protein
MRFMMIVKASKESEAGVMPSRKLLADMQQYNDELSKAGMLLDLSGLHPSAEAVRVRFSGGKTAVIDGPFAETRELVGGYWLIQAKSKEEAIEWARRAPNPNEHGDGEIEIRQLFELEDLASGPEVEQARELEKKVVRSKEMTRNLE